MKKLLILITSLALVFAFTACGGGSGPDAAVKSDLDKIKSEEIDEDFAESFGMSDEDIDVDSYKDFAEKLQDFDYEIGDVKEDGDKATVKVKITTYDFASALEDAFGDIMAMAFSGETADENEMMKAFFKKLGEPEKKDFSKEVTINCTKKDGEWETDCEDNEDLMDAVLGGMISSLKDLEGLTDGMEDAEDAEE